MIRNLAILCLLLVPLSSCHRPPQTVATSTKSYAYAAPGRDEIDVLFHGLVAFVFKADGTARSVFVSPAMEPHRPLLSIATGDIHKTNASVPEMVLGGTGLGVWDFTEITIDPAEFTETSLKVSPEALGQNEENFAKLRWIPSMDEIFGSPQRVKESEVDAAPARGSWPIGRLYPVFDLDPSSMKYDIGQRRGRAVADGVRIRLTLRDPGLPAGLKLTRKGSSDTILVKGGATILLSDYPAPIPRPTNELPHFVHYYTLCDGCTSQPVPVPIPPPMANPARCAPALFFPGLN